MKEEVREAVEVLNSGGIVIFPTDTAFGIGCRIDNEEAIKRLFKIRRRPHDKAAPVLVSSVQMARQYVLEIPQEVEEKLIKRYWPGALTMILRCIEGKVPSLVRGGGNTIGVRMPDHATILEIIEKVGVPILGPSANFHGEVTPYKFEDIDLELVRLVDCVVDGEANPQKEASTVIDCTVKPWKIVREGAVKISI